MSYNMPNMLNTEFQIQSIKIVDFKINTIYRFNPISTKGGEWNF